jgi:hypothetical protein
VRKFLNVCQIKVRWNSVKSRRMVYCRPQMLKKQSSDAEAATICSQLKNVPLDECRAMLRMA